MLLIVRSMTAFTYSGPNIGPRLEGSKRAELLCAQRCPLRIEGALPYGGDLDIFRFGNILMLILAILAVSYPLLTVRFPKKVGDALIIIVSSVASIMLLQTLFEVTRLARAGEEYLVDHSDFGEYGRTYYVEPGYYAFVGVVALIVFLTLLFVIYCVRMGQKNSTVER